MERYMLIALLTLIGVFVIVSLIAGTRTAISMYSWVFRTAFLGLWRLFVLIFHRVRRQGVSHAPRLASNRGTVLLPGLHTPLPGTQRDYMDYRGVAVPKELTQLRGTGVSLGQYMHANGRREGSLFMGHDILHHHCAVIGPPGSGKTEGVIIPWIQELLSMGHSVVTIDVKGDLYDRLSPVAERYGCRVWYWNISDVSRSQSWNWLESISDSRDVEAAVQSVLGKPRPNDSQPFFYERDYRWLRALINIVKVVDIHARPGMLYRLAGGQETLRDLFTRYTDTRRYASDVADLLQFSPDEHSRVVSGLLNALHLFNEPSVERVTAHSDFTLNDICSAPTLLVVGASLADARASEILSSMMLSLLFTSVYRRFSGSHGDDDKQSLFFIIDEAPRVKDRINLEEILSVSRSARVGICLAAQDVSQFGAEREASAILTSCLTFIALKGCSAETARYLSARLGQRVENVVDSGKGHGPYELLNHTNNTSRNESVPVLREREIMYPPAGQYVGVAHVSRVSHKPFLVDLTRG